MLQDGKFNAIGFMPPGDYAIAEMIRSPYGRELVLGVSLACDEAGATLSLVNGTEKRAPPPFGKRWSTASFWATARTSN